MLLGYITSPLKVIALGFIGYLPELFMILVVVFITFYIFRAINFISVEVERGNLSIPGFYPEWSRPTFNLVKIIIIAFSFIVIFPYLPGSDSPAFQGVSVFLGLLISLGSSSAISNIIAGLVIIYMRAFKLGDRVKIGDTTGDVIEKTMLVTRLRTIKNEEVTIPNASILAGKTINYSVEANGPGLILHSTVTIGYDIPWKQVHKLLIGAALKTDRILKEPSPFVLQTSLDDFYVSYQINAYTITPEKAALIYSDLHSFIQDAFNEAGVEIMSPHYRAARDGNQITFPPTYLPEGAPRTM
jgi:small-conductance mechanosensitive channel